MINDLMKRMSRRNFLIGKKRNNNGIMWITLLSLAAGTVGYGIKRFGLNKMMQTVQDKMYNFRIKNGNPLSKMTTVLSEFSKELVPSKNQINNNSSNNRENHPDNI